jgi:hypothetical protein
MKEYLPIYEFLMKDLAEEAKGIKTKQDYRIYIDKVEKLKRIHLLISNFYTESLDDILLTTRKHLEKF